jgi:hypothetical protein
VVAANKLITDGRAKLGTYCGSCKDWARAIVQSSHGSTIPGTLADNICWDDKPSVDSQVSQWRGSYANGRLGPTTLLAHGSTSASVYVPNGDPQVVVVYASAINVSAAIVKSGSATLSVTSIGTTGGTISSGTTTGAGNWTLTVTNNGSVTATGVVAVVLSKSRFQSEWQSARRGDIIQMYVGTLAANRGSANPHTALVQTDYNANGGTSRSDNSLQSANTDGCNWLDSNWSSPEDGRVRAHNTTTDQMMLMAVYSPKYGFTVYRLK